MKKYSVILFQPYLRRFVLNFGNHLKEFDFIQVAKPPRQGLGYHTLPSYDKEINRSKTNLKSIIRRLIGIPNFRFKFDKRGDLYFTYGTLLVTNKPYCVYIETGLTLYNYDLKIAKNPIARWIVMFLASRRSCRQLIFLSQASKKSFFSTVRYPSSIKDKLEAKSSVIYPAPVSQHNAKTKKWNGTLKLLFPGTFYMKGGQEVLNAFIKARQQHSNISLTVITALHMLKKEDREHMDSIDGLNLMDARLSEQEMIDVYKSHDVFILPTYRDGFGLVLIEALAYGMPLIITDQYATGEMVIDGYNGYIYPNHPLKDYDPSTYKIHGKYHNPKDLYQKLFALQKEGGMKPIENFLESSIEKFLNNPLLLERFSRNSLQLYKDKFDADMLGSQLEEVFKRSIKN